MKYLFDTDHVSVLQRQSGSEFVTLMSRVAQHPPGDLVLSVIGFHEQMLGCQTYIARARSSADLIRGYAMLGRLLIDYSTAVVLPFDQSAALVFDGLISQRIRIGSMDLRIASIALSRGLTILTRNARDFRQVPGLMIEDWTV